MTKQAGLSPQMTIERAQMIAMRLADTANRMVKTGELSRFQVGRCSGIELPSRFYLREAIRDIKCAPTSSNAM